jgi:hypothetical protein
LSFHSLVEIPGEGSAPYTPDFQCRLYDLSPFGKDRLAGNALVRIVGDLLGAAGRPDFEERVTRALRTLNELANAPGFARYLEIFFRYILQVFDIPKEDLGHLVTETLKPGMKEFLMTTYEQFIQEGEEKGLQKGLQIGLQQGAQKATNRFLTQLIAKKFQQDVGELAPLLGNLDAKRHEELIERILQSRSLQEVIDWLKSVGTN